MLKIRKLAALVLALCLVLGPLSVPVRAQDEGSSASSSVYGNCPPVPNQDNPYAGPLKAAKAQLAK